MKRRNFLKNSFYTALTTTIRASVIGVPANFLLSGQVSASAFSVKTTILSQSRQGESIGCNGPGSFTNNNGSAVKLIEHPTESELGSQKLGSVAGTEFSGSDLGKKKSIQLGSQSVLASKPWGALPQELLNHLSCVWYQTGASSHPEMVSVRKLKGALKDDLNPNRTEELSSAIALENSGSMGSTLNTPLLLDDAGTSKGNPLAVYRPSDLKGLFAESSGASGLAADNFGALYSKSIDMLYSNLKKNGSKKQKAFLDNHALTRLQAQDLGENLGAALSLVEGNSFVDQLRTALAFAKIRMSPVIVVQHEFSKDNHSDSTLMEEASRTLDALDTLNTYWALLNEQNLVDEVNFATLDVFGRTPLRNATGGRDHWGHLAQGLILGSDVKGGLVGGVTTDSRNRIVASGIRSRVDGNIDIAGDTTLASYGKTIMKAAGIEDEKLNIRIPSGKVIQQVFQ